MDISGISTSLNTGGPNARSLGPAESIRTHDRAEREAPLQQVRGVRGRRGLALGVLKQELRMTLRAHFHARFASTNNAYAGPREAATSDDVAEEALGAAKQLVAESPAKASKALISFRARVQETASYVRETVGVENDDVDEIDNVVAKVDKGLDELEGKVANNRESSASVLAVDTRSKQRSSIQIRTQEGDVVKFSLKRVESMSATDVAKSDGEMRVTSTEVAVSSRSRMKMSVEGDLNESELSAIQNVFAQAEMIADEFFGGDIGAAFNVAQGFEFDTEQLARVNMKFRMREITNVAYSETIRRTPIAGPEAPVVTTPVAPEPIVSRPVATPVDETPPELDTQPVVEADATDGPVAEQPALPDPVVAPEVSALESFFDTLSAFLRSVGEGFEGSASESSFRFHYTESFKLEILKVVLNTTAPGDVMHAAENASTMIDSINETAAESA